MCKFLSTFKALPFYFLPISSLFLIASSTTFATSHNNTESARPHASVVPPITSTVIFDGGKVISNQITHSTKSSEIDMDVDQPAWYCIDGRLNNLSHKKALKLSSFDHGSNSCEGTANRLLEDVLQDKAPRTALDDAIYACPDSQGALKASQLLFVKFADRGWSTLAMLYFNLLTSHPHFYQLSDKEKIRILKLGYIVSTSNGDTQECLTLENELKKLDGISNKSISELKQISVTMASHLTSEKRISENFRSYFFATSIDDNPLDSHNMAYEKETFAHLVSRHFDVPKIRQLLELPEEGIDGECLIFGLGTLNNDTYKGDSMHLWNLESYLPPKSRINLLRTLLQSEFTENRWQAAKKLGKETEQREVVTESLTKALKDPEDEVRYNALLALNQHGDKELFLYETRKALNYDSPYVRVSMALFLSENKDFAEKMVYDLIIALSDRNELVRMHATRAIESIGKEASAASPKLVSLLIDDNRFVRMSASLALLKMGEPGIESLARALNDPHPAIRQHAATLLGGFETHTTLATEGLIKALQDETYYVRRAAAKSLGQMGPKAKAALPALKRASENDTSIDVKELSLIAISKIES